MENIIWASATDLGKLLNTCVAVLARIGARNTNTAMRSRTIVRAEARERRPDRKTFTRRSRDTKVSTFQTISLYFTVKAGNPSSHAVSSRIESEGVMNRDGWCELPRDMVTIPTVVRMNSTSRFVGLIGFCLRGDIVGLQVSLLRAVGSTKAFLSYSTFTKLMRFRR